MKNIYILLVICFSYINNISSQSNFEFEISEGFVFFDYFNKNYPQKYDNVFSGYGIQSEFTIWKNIFNVKNINFKSGIGFTNYYYLNSNYAFLFFARNENSTNYINFKFGIDFKPIWIPVSILLNQSNYLYLFKEKQRESQNRWFSIIDLGFRVNLRKNMRLCLSTPITISPIDNGKFLLRPLDFDLDIEPWIEITGLNLGISYGFGGKN